LSAYSDEFERRFQSIVNAGSDDFERAGVLEGGLGVHVGVQARAKRLHRKRSSGGTGFSLA
jgi:hypothetical protein